MLRRDRDCAQRACAGAVLEEALMDDKLISKLDAADMLGVSVKTVERMIADGDLPMYKIRGQCRLMTSDVRTYIAGCRRVAAKAAPVPARRQPARRGSKLVGCGYYPGMKVV